MHYKKGLVSVVIPTYRRSEKVERAIESILNQTYDHVEVIVVNDNNPDDQYTLDLRNRLTKYMVDERFRFVLQERHTNGAVARNVGISVASGEYIAFLDDDDYWNLNKLELQVKELSELDVTWGAVSCLMSIYLKGKLFYSTIPYSSGDIFMQVLCRKISLGTGSVLIRRNALDTIGYFDENLERHQDLQLFVNLTSKYKIKLINKYLHNREIEDSQNRPSAKKLIEIKKAYFTSINNVLIKLDSKERDKVLVMHDFESAYAYFKEGLLNEAFVYAKKVLLCKSTIYLAFDRIFRRLIERHFRYILQKIYK